MHRPTTTFHLFVPININEAAMPFPATFLLVVMIFLNGCGSRVPGNDMAGKTMLYFFDVGEGAATLIDSPDLGRVLIDTGNPSSRLVTKLAANGIDWIDRVIVTHPHPDHAGGIHSILEFFSPAIISDNGEILSLEDPSQRWYKEAVRDGPGYVPLKGGDRIAAGTSTLVVYWPEAMVGDWNSNSLVLALSVGETKILLMADGNLATEAELLKSGRDLAAHILQVGHHGSSSASGAEFLRAVSPQYVVVSVNRGNVNGYPAEQTLDFLQKRGIRTLLTSEHGDIVFAIEPQTGTITMGYTYE